MQLLFLLDKNKRLQYAPLNGVTYKNIYGNTHLNLSSIKFYTDGNTFEKSDACLSICKILGGRYQLAIIFKIMPLFLRDKIYDQIARKRKIISCIYIDKKSNIQFLD